MAPRSRSLSNLGFFGFLLADYVVRATMVQAAKRSAVAPAELSFVHTVRVIRRKLAFPPSEPETGGQDI